MKNLFFVAVAFGIFPGTINAVKAQSSFTAKETSKKKKQVISLKFIDDIEISPADGHVAYNDIAIAEPVVEKSSYFIPASTVASTSIETCKSLQFKYALLMDRDVEAVTNTALFTSIDEWWGTRYHYGGTTKSGIDCSAFTGKLLAAAYNITAPRTAKEQYDLCEKIDSSNLQEGDLVFFNTRGGVSHVGMYLGNNYFVHSSVQSGVTISSMADGYYNRKFIGGGRLHN